jgi:hypothetical protein
MASSIINSDDGVISGTSGIKTTGGDDGVLVFQSKGTETARINTDKQIVAAAGTASLPALTTTGDLNTGIFFPAADTIAFGEGGAEAMRIDDSGRVGIGNTNAGSYDAAGRNLVIGNASGNTGLTISSGNANSGWIFFADGTTGTAPYVGYVEYSHANNTMNFITNAGERGRFVTNGLQVTNCVGVGNTAPSSSGAGITFPATQSASSDANTLDDYEEGTFTPTLSSSATAPTVSSYNVRVGTYTKIGNLVTAICAFDVNISSAGSGYPIITGLPFTIGVGAESGISLGRWAGFNSIIPVRAIVLSAAVYFESSSYVTGNNLNINFVATYRV